MLGHAAIAVPDVTTHEAETVDAVFDATDVGRVRVTFQKFRGTHRRHRLLFWLAERRLD